MTVRILVGDCRERLSELPDASVHCVVTSPPYFGLRDYGTGAWEGGDAACDHKRDKGNTRSTIEGATTSQHCVFKEACGRCGATRIDRQMGLEPTPDDYVEAMVAVFRDLRRVLRDDGTLWLNIGDSYAGSWGAQGKRESPGEISRNSITNHPKMSRTGSTASFGCKPKDLIGIPWRLAFALQADGWFLRQDIIWSKPNPMPESVIDRCTKAHEYLFLLSKSRRYYFDAAAIADASTGGHPSGNVERKQRPDAPAGHSGAQAGNVPWQGATRNKRSVWDVATQPFSEAHFATYPPALIEPCILAGASEKGCCSRCGAPWLRVVTKGEPDEDHRRRCGADSSGGYDGAGKVDPAGKAQTPGDVKRRILDGMRTKTSEWVPGCGCAAAVVPATVLDPFFGAGTTGLVADRLGRNCIGIELNPEYAAIAERRLKGDGGLFSDVASEAA
jgi:DNA modification methylase